MSGPGPLDPGPVTGAAQQEGEAAVDLFHQFRFRLLFQLGQELLDPAPDILGEFLGADFRRRWVGNSFDRDTKKVPGARPEFDPAAGATWARKVSKLVRSGAHG